MSITELLLRPLSTFKTGDAEPVEDDNPSQVADEQLDMFEPGMVGAIVTVSGDTDIYEVATPGNAFRIRWSYAVPVVRGSEEPPVITIKLLNPDLSVYKTPFVAAALSKRKRIDGPVDGKLVVNLDIAARVACTFDIEEFTP